MLHGSTIVAVRTPRDIYIGADSKVVDGEGAPSGSGACKIHVANDVVFAQAGWFILGGGRGREVNFVEVTRRALLGGGSVGARVGAFEKAAIPRLREGALALRKDDPGFFAKEVEGKAVVQVVFAAREGPALLLVQEYFTVRARGGSLEIEATRHECPGDCGPDEIAEAILGARDALGPALAAKPYKKDIPSGIESLIRIESEAAPGQVGGPTAVLHIGADGRLEWLEPGLCQPEKQTQKQ